MCYVSKEKNGGKVMSWTRDGEEGRGIGVKKKDGK